MNEKNHLQNMKSLAFRLTDLCNLNCVFCGQAKQMNAESEKKARHFLELHELMHIVDQLIPYMPQVYLWGGEPLVYPKLREFIQYLREKKLSVFITTNGVLLDKYYKYFVEHKVTGLTISIEGFKDCHEKVRGVKGVYDRIMSNLELLHSYKKLQNKVFPVVDINVVINEENYKQLNKFCEFLFSLGWINKVRLQLPMYFLKDASDEFSDYVSRVFHVDHGVSWRYFTYEYAKIDLSVLERGLGQALLNKKTQLFPPSADIKKWFLEPNIRFKQCCATAFSRINVEPNGDLITCTDFNETVYGNALNEPIEKLFNNEIINNHRKTLLEKQLKLCCRCSHLYLY